MLSTYHSFVYLEYSTFILWSWSCLKSCGTENSDFLSNMRYLNVVSPQILKLGLGLGPGHLFR